MAPEHPAILDGARVCHLHMQFLRQIRRNHLWPLCDDYPAILALQQVIERNVLVIGLIMIMVSRLEEPEAALVMLDRIGSEEQGDPAPLREYANSEDERKVYPGFVADPITLLRKRFSTRGQFLVEHCPYPTIIYPRLVRPDDRRVRIVWITEKARVREVQVGNVE